MPKPESKMMKRRLANAYLSSVISITLVLLLIGVAAFVVINSGSVARYLKENVKISVLFVQNATEQDAEEYLGSVRALPYVHDTRLITREEGERELAEMLGEDFLDVFETSPVPISVDVTLNAEYVVPDSLAFVSEVLAASPMVEEVDSQQPLVAILNENLAKISAVFGVFILLLRADQQYGAAQRVRAQVHHPHHEAGRRHQGFHPGSVPARRAGAGPDLGVPGLRGHLGHLLRGAKLLQRAVRDIRHRDAARIYRNHFRVRRADMRAEHLFCRWQACQREQGRTLLLIWTEWQLPRGGSRSLSPGWS